MGRRRRNEPKRRYIPIWRKIHNSNQCMCSKILKAHLPRFWHSYTAVVCSNIVNHFWDNNLISQKHSGLRWLWGYITYEIFTLFDNGFELRGVFPDISKVFCKVCQAELIHMLRPNGTNYILLDLLVGVLKY